MNERKNETCLSDCSLMNLEINVDGIDAFHDVRNPLNHICDALGVHRAVY